MYAVGWSARQEGAELLSQLAQVLLKPRGQRLDQAILPPPAKSG